MALNGSQTGRYVTPDLFIFASNYNLLIKISNVVTCESSYIIVLSVPEYFMHYIIKMRI